LDTAAFIGWCERYAYAFGDVQAWMDFLRKFDFVIGTRVHGAMLALQAGVPAACIAHDSRTLELCETMGMPARSFAEIGTLTQDNLTQVFKFDEMSFRETRRRLLQAYVRIYDSAEVMITEALAQLLQK
jgi:polysaccharide pyruvyl transferase WcaK-like protein